MTLIRKQLLREPVSGDPAALIAEMKASGFVAAT